MTTVAFDGITLASDSRSTGGYIDDKTKKIWKLKDGAYMSGAGDYTAILVFKRWYEGGQDYNNKPEATGEKELDFEVIVIKDGESSFYDSNFEPFNMSIPCCIGSGCQLAMAALEHGATAKEAIRTAAKYDEGTGGKIQSVKVREV